MSAVGDPDALLAAEARAFGRYLVGAEPDDALARRYADACRALLSGETEEREGRVVDLARRRPWLLPWLDGGAALLRPGALLRRKLLLLSAVLETTPRFADEFLPRRARLPRLVLELAGAGLLGLLHAVVGAPLFLLVAGGGLVAGRGRR